MFVKEAGRIRRNLIRRDPRASMAPERFRDWLRSQQSSDGVWRCAYCRAFIGAQEISIDHRAPVSLGGSAEPDNLAVCCSRCNRAKGDLTDVEYVELLAVLDRLGERARSSVLRRLCAAPAWARANKRR